jgi:hypothetical protein
MDSTLQTALDQDVVGFFTGVEIQHPEGTIRLLDAPGVLTFNSSQWSGDQAIGSLGAVDMAEDGDTEAPTFVATILPANDTVIPTYAVPAAQGSIVNWWIGAFSPSTGLVIGQPELRFAGEVDFVTFSDGDASALSFNCVSGFERFFDTDDGARLGDAFHQSVWPGEKGFQYLTAILDQMPWGIDGARPPIKYAA